MKSVFVVALVSLAVTFANGQLHCTSKPANVPKEWIDMVSPCVREMRGQIQEEINASLKYMAMGAHFARDTINRPGFSKLFFDSASEEREHAIKLIHYLLMRGELVSSVSNLIKTSVNVPTSTWDSGLSALKDALRTEAFVTKNIRKVIKQCEEPSDNSQFNDYHLSDYLTGEFLEEQYKGQRDLAGKISQLEKLMEKHGPLGEFLFDKKLV